MASRSFFANPQEMPFEPFLPFESDADKGAGPQRIGNWRTVANTGREVYQPSVTRSIKRLGNGISPVDSSSDAMGNMGKRSELQRGHLPAIPKRFSRQEAPNVTFRPLQQWEGVVMQVMPKTFLVRLIDSRDESLVEEAEVELEEVSPEDRELVREGVFCYGELRYLHPFDRRQRSSTFRFRRLPNWTPTQIDAARQEAARVRELIGWK